MELSPTVKMMIYTKETTAKDRFIVQYLFQDVWDMGFQFICANAFPFFIFEKH